jgi:hypothetical protein
MSAKTPTDVEVRGRHGDQPLSQKDARFEMVAPT